jgi:hypothetical protein
VGADSFGSEPGVYYGGDGDRVIDVLDALEIQQRRRQRLRRNHQKRLQKKPCSEMTVGSRAIPIGGEER